MNQTQMLNNIMKTLDTVLQKLEIKQENEWVDEAEAMRISRRSVRTLRALRTSGKILWRTPTGRKIEYNRASLMNYVGSLTSQPVTA